MPLGLLATVALACLGFAFAPSPPPPPPMDPEEIAALQRSIDRLVADTRGWQASRGDRLLAWDDAEGHLAIVIDDIGRELHLFEQLLDLRYPLSFSVLPGAVYAAGTQLRLREDRRRYREIMLHLPMEPLEAARMREDVEAQEHFLLASDDADALRTKLADALARVPAAVGVNNHMGSRLSTDRAAMAAIMPVLRERGLFFVDSRTTAETVAEAAARAAGVPAAARQVFLDDDPSPDAIEHELQRAATLSRTQPVIVIAHSSPAVVDVLRTRLPELYGQRIGIYPVSTVVQHLLQHQHPVQNQDRHGALVTPPTASRTTGAGSAAPDPHTDHNDD